MATGGSIWGIDVGQCGLKAVKLRAAGDQVELVAFDIIEHPKILSQPDADPDELIKAALDKFLSRNDWQGDKFVIGVPGQQTFARFCKLPPVDAKKIPDIVKFEASQQIPFDMDEVVWDYQVFTSEDSPDVEVGIFAIKKDLIRKHLQFFSDANIAPIAVQTTPSALYNFFRFDQPEPKDGTAAVIIDIGAQNTDLIIAEQNGAWSRNIPLGGNNFTEALVKAFKLSFAKAESLKKTAATSKYARQIFQAMRPVFAELVAEIQRSIGFYTSTHREVELRRVIGLGNAFRLPGLQKYLENNLTIPGGVTKLEKFAKVVPSETINAPQFTDNVLSFGVSYGLALQGLGLSAISASLLPPDLARIALWNKKRPYFAATAACLALASSFVWARQVMDGNAIDADPTNARGKTLKIISEAERYNTDFAKVSTDTGSKVKQIERYLELSKDKLLVPRILALVHEAMPEVAPELAAADTADALKKLIEADKVRFARTARKQVYIETFKVTYHDDIETLDITQPDSSGSQGFTGAAIGEGAAGHNVWNAGIQQDPTEEKAGGGAGFRVEIIGRMMYGTSQADAMNFLITEYLDRIKRLGRVSGLGFHVLDEKIPTESEANEPVLTPETYYRTDEKSFMQAENVAAGTEDVPEEFQDSITKEDMRSDWRFELVFKVKLGDMPETAADKKNE